MNKNGASVSPWSTPVVISKSSDVPSVVTTLALVLVYIDLIPISSRGGIPYAFRILQHLFSPDRIKRLFEVRKCYNCREVVLSHLLKDVM